MSHTELARWENTHDTVLLHSEENLAIVPQNMQQEGLSADRRDYDVMVRVVNVAEALRLYTRQHPDLHTTLTIVGDSDLPSNNGTYLLHDGQLQRLLTPTNEARTIKIGALIEMLFPTPIRLTMMLER